MWAVRTFRFFPEFAHRQIGFLIKQTERQVLAVRQCHAVKFKKSTASPKRLPHLDEVIKVVSSKIHEQFRVDRNDGDILLNAIAAESQISSEYAMIALTCFGSAMSNELPEERTKLLVKLWMLLQSSAVDLGISHYDALLKAYANNNFAIVPEQFLADIKAKGLTPTRHTYNELADQYARQGNVERIQNMMEVVRKQFKNVHVEIYNALITAYGQRGERKLAEKVLNQMYDIEPNSDTYIRLMCVFASTNDIKSILQNEYELTDVDVLKIIDALLKNGHAVQIDSLFKHVRTTRNFNNEATNFIYHLLNEDHVNVVTQILVHMYKDHGADASSNKGDFIIKHMVKLNRTPNAIFRVCHLLRDMGLTGDAREVYLHALVQIRSVGECLQFLRKHQHQFHPLSEHLFSIFFQNINENDALMVTRIMLEEFQIEPDIKFINDHIVKNLDLKNPEKLTKDLIKTGLRTTAIAKSVVFWCIRRNKLNDAVNIAIKYKISLSPVFCKKELIAAVTLTKDFTSYIKILRNFLENLERLEKHVGGAYTDPNEMLTQIISETILNFDSDDRIKVTRIILDGLRHEEIGLPKHQTERLHRQLKCEDVITTEISNQLNYLPVHYSMLKTLAQHYAQNNLTEFIESLDKFRDQGFITRAVTYSQIIELCINAGNFNKALDEFYDAAVNIPGFHLINNVTKLIAHLIESDRLADALKFLETNKRSDLHPQSYKYDQLIALLDYYRDYGMTKKALDLWKILDRKNALPGFMRNRFIKKLNSMNIKVASK